MSNQRLITLMLMTEVRKLLVNNKGASKLNDFARTNLNFLKTVRSFSPTIEEMEKAINERPDELCHLKESMEELKGHDTSLILFHALAKELKTNRKPCNCG